MPRRGDVHSHEPLSKSVLVSPAPCRATAQSQANDVLREEWATTLEAAVPAYFPNHTPRVLVQHRLPANAPVERPRVRFDDADGERLPAHTERHMRPGRRWWWRRFGSRWRWWLSLALAPCYQPRWLTVTEHVPPPIRPRFPKPSECPICRGIPGPARPCSLPHMLGRQRHPMNRRI